ncbi:uncharacterized protein LOC124154379 [Ischnura elegans]|uniref:uncharacterized protein LOC124154379 n=1 Tax=Ischnura elegans TaxID=197161 RepID=UPI001ED89771|nr:uncharacterized protein LOC124154379 [Ischnura elegans]
MATMRQLIVFGAAIALATFARADLFIEPLEGFIECRQKVLDQRFVIKDCLGQDFSDVAMNATIELYKDSRCPTCMHSCSKVDEIHRCIGESWDVLPLPSNKSAEMVPFVRSLVEEGFHTLCENRAAMFRMILEQENYDCLMGAWRTCSEIVKGWEDLDLIAFCEITDKPELDPFSKDTICQKFKNFFECGLEETRICTEEVKTSLNQVISMWRSQPFCSKFYHTEE